MIDVYEQLMGAVVENNVEEVQRLIENGIDLNGRSDQGASALFGAILHGNLSIIRLMLEHGWTLTKGKILSGQGTDSVTVPSVI